MLKTEQIAAMDTKNISRDLEHTKKVFEEVWTSATNEQKNRAAQLGGYPNTKSFSPSRSNGRISVRMTVAMSITFNLNPFFLIGEIKEKQPFSDRVLNEFLIFFGFGKYCIREPIILDNVNNEEILTKSQLLDFIKKIIEETNIDKSLSREDALILFNALQVEEKFKKPNAFLKMELIKLILLYK